MGDYDDLAAWGSAVPAAAPSGGNVATADPYADLMKWGAPEAPGAGTSVARGALQGASLGFGDEAAAAIDTAVSHIPGLRTLAQGLHSPDLPTLTGPATYQERREAYRAKNAAAEQANPLAYGAGELAGGLATTPLIPGGAAKTLGGAIVKGAKVGAALGGINALGMSKADLTQGDVGQAATDVASGAAGGGVLGGFIGGAGHVAGKALTGGAEKLKKWIGADLIGETKGASTEAAKKMVRQDIKDIADVVTADPRLDRAIAKASRQTPAALEHAADAVDAKITEVTAPRPELYKALDQELGGGVRAGDYVKHLEDSIGDLRATGKGSDRAIASELQHHVSELKTARDWGYQPAAANPEEAQILSNLQQQRTARLARGEGTAEVDRAIGEMTASSKAWNPDAIVPAERLRADVTDLQKTAAQRMGAINGTPNYVRGREVASHGEDFLRGVKARAGATKPDLIAAIDEHDRQFSALARMRDILDQRLEKAKASEMAALGEGKLAELTHLASKHGIVKAGTLGLGRAAVGAKRLLDRGVANAEASAASGDKFSRLVLDGLRKGLPLTASVAAAEEAGRLAGE